MKRHRQSIFYGQSVAGRLAVPIPGLGVFNDWLDYKFRTVERGEVLLVLGEPECFFPDGENPSYALRCLTQSGIGFVSEGGVTLL